MAPDENGLPTMLLFDKGSISVTLLTGADDWMVVSATARD
jgi:hypothetical protein